MATKVREIIKILEANGWFFVRQKGSHKQFKHRQKLGTVTVSVHSLSDDLSPATLNSILKQAELK